MRFRPAGPQVSSPEVMAVECTRIRREVGVGAGSGWVVERVRVVVFVLRRRACWVAGRGVVILGGGGGGMVGDADVIERKVG